MNKKLNIALVAHDSRKRELMEWVRHNIQTLMNHTIYATGTTGRLIIDEFYEYEMPKLAIWDEESYKNRTSEYYKDRIIRLLSGPLGGDQQIGAMIAEGKIDILIFFCDNLITQGHQQDVGALTRLAALYNIAFATNRTTADMIITSSLLNDENYIMEVPTIIDVYNNRQI